MPKKSVDLGLLQMQILWFLSKNPTHGYELTKQLNQVKQTKVTQSTMYPALAKLVELGLVESKTEGSRGKRIYRVSRKGKRALEKAMTDFCSCFIGIFKDAHCSKCGSRVECK
ncbi:MAG: PadR family transcriptional regulator [Candidatus Micrarchaeota archaeon]